MTKMFYDTFELFKLTQSLLYKLKVSNKLQWKGTVGYLITLC